VRSLVLPAVPAGAEGGIATSRHSIRADGADCCLVEIDWKPVL